MSFCALLTSFEIFIKCTSWWYSTHIVNAWWFMFQHRIFFNVMCIFWHDCFGGVIFHTGVMEPQRMGGFLGEKYFGYFSITKCQYPKKQLQWIVWGLWPRYTDQLFFFLISYYFGTLNRKISCFLNICVFISHVVTSGGKNGCSFDVTYEWAHDPNKFFLDFVMLFV